jgi:hypothetical protein
MCRFHTYRKMLAGRSPNYRQEIVNMLRERHCHNSLARLEMARAALLTLKMQLTSDPSLNIKAAIQQTIGRLETAPRRQGV